MDYVNATPRVNGVFEDNGPSNPTARQCTPHFSLDGVKVNFMDAWYFSINHMPIF
jgi:hypothetical protein